MKEFLEALRTHGRVLYALMLREARTRYGRRRAGYLWGLVEPLMHIAFFYLVYKFIRMRHPPLGDSLFVFLATGLVPFIGWRNMFMRVQGGYGSNAGLLVFPSVTMMDAFVGRALLELATWILVLILIFSGMIAYGAPFPQDVLKLVSAILALFMIAFGLGLCLGVITEFVPSIGSFWRFVRRFLYWFSGAFFLPDTLPAVMRDILAWNPILHGITLFREGYYFGYESKMLDVGYLYGWAIFSVLLAFLVEKVARKPIRNIV